MIKFSYGRYYSHESSHVGIWIATCSFDIQAAGVQFPVQKHMECGLIPRLPLLIVLAIAI